MNSIGLKRRKFTKDQINQIQNIYRIIYLEGRNNSQAIEKIKSDIKESSEKSIVVNFLENSERGIIKGILDWQWKLFVKIFQKNLDLKK